MIKIDSNSIMNITIKLCKILCIFYMVGCDFLRLPQDSLEREKIGAKIGEKFWEENGGWL